MAHRRPFPFPSNVQLFLLIFLAVVIHLAQLQPATQQTEQQPKKAEEKHPISRCSRISNLSVPPATDSDPSDSDGLEEMAEWIYEGKESAEVVEEMMKNQISFKMASVERGKSGEFAIESERQMQIDEHQQQQQQQQKHSKEENVVDECKSSQSATAEKERTTLGKLFDDADEVKRALEEVELDWRQKVDKKRHRQMEKELRRLEKERKAAENLQPAQQQLGAAARRKLYGAEFDTAKFRADVEAWKPCDDEPLQVAEFYLFRWSSKLGLYHAGLFVCGIEIHFNCLGIAFWKPMEYSTSFAGELHRKYRPINYDGKELYTKKTFGQIVAIVSQLKKTFNPSTYNLLSRNCLLFVRTFVRQLTGLTNGEQIEWPWSAIHPLKKPEFALKKLKARHFKNKGTEAKKYDD